MKRELRHSWLSDGRRESVAEHTFSLAMMAIVAAGHLTVPVDLRRVLVIALVHDLPELHTGDIPYMDKEPSAEAAEDAAMVQLLQSIGEPAAEEMRSAWLDWRTGTTAEARLVRALDDIEVQVQHNLADNASWTEQERAIARTKPARNCSHEPFLRSVAEAVIADAARKFDQPS